MKLRFGLLLLLVSVLSSAVAHAIGEIVDISQRAPGQWYGIDNAGTLFEYSGGGAVPEHWSAVGSIPEFAGRPATGVFVAVSHISDYWAMGAITDQGEFYAATVSGWEFRSVIGSSAGHAPTGPFVALENAGLLGAITNQGQLYHLNVDGISWSYIGSIPADTGMTEVDHSTIGKLKALFR